MVLAAAILARGLPAQSVSGQVKDRQTSAPVARVAVTLMDSAGFVLVVQTTQDDGRFVLTAPRAGRYRLRFLVPGYNPLVTGLLRLAAGQELDYSAALRPVPPTVLDTLTVEGQPIPWNLEGFYQRKHRAFGDFATREDWERWGTMDVYGVIRHINPFVLQPNAGRGPSLHGGCTAAVFLDNLPVTPDFDLNNLFLDNLAAIEVYRSPEVPPEFDRPFGVCAAIAMWSRLNTETEPRRIAVGAQVGGAVVGGGGLGGRIGVHLLIGFEGMLELYPSVSFIGGLPGSSATSRTGWELLPAVRVRPLGRGTGWYVGVGERLASLKATDTLRAVDERDLAVLSGLELKIGGARPFVELQVLDPFQPGSAVLNVFFGVSTRIH